MAKDAPSEGHSERLAAATQLLATLTAGRARAQAIAERHLDFAALVRLHRTGLSDGDAVSEAHRVADAVQRSLALYRAARVTAPVVVVTSAPAPAAPAPAAPAELAPARPPEPEPDFSGLVGGLDDEPVDDEPSYEVAYIGDDPEDAGQEDAGQEDAGHDNAAAEGDYADGFDEDAGEAWSEGIQRDYDDDAEISGFLVQPGEPPVHEGDDTLEDDATAASVDQPAEGTDEEPYTYRASYQVEDDEPEPEPQESVIGAGDWVVDADAETLDEDELQATVGAVTDAGPSGERVDDPDTFDTADAVIAPAIAVDEAAGADDGIGIAAPRSVGPQISLSADDEDDFEDDYEDGPARIHIGSDGEASPVVAVGGGEELMAAPASEGFLGDEEPGPGGGFAVSFEVAEAEEELEEFEEEADPGVPRLTDDEPVDPSLITNLDLQPVEEIDPARLQRFIDEAVQAERSGDLHGAIVHYGDALDLSPDHKDAHLGRGRALMELGDYAAAMSDFQRAEDLNPGAPEPLVEMGHLYFARKEYRRAIDFYDQALEIDGAIAMALVRRGMSHHYRRSHRQAFQDLQRAYSLDPDIPNIKKYVQMAVKAMERDRGAAR